MSQTSYWDQRNNRILSQVGHWQGGVDVTIQGYSLMNNLMKSASLMQVNILNATGKLVNRAVADWLEKNFMGLSYPDSRIWCNQISSYCADTNSSVVSSASSAILSADSRAYGGSQTTFSCMKFLKSALQKFDEGVDFEAIVSDSNFRQGKPTIVGFARPVDKNDERLTAYIASQEALKLKRGKYLSFAMKLSEYIFNQYNLSINSGGYASAFLLDQGFSPDDGYRIKAFSVVSGAIACHRDLEKQPPNSFLPMKCTDIHYTGPKPREVPE